ncbi:MAG: DUF4349 domain-containing protein [Prevotellaceae bacterium]|jgi:hypothetical protein|nr:DUF4349 domain-containing protein [Prevotellaceae bacterium]
MQKHILFPLACLLVFISCGKKSEAPMAEDIVKEEVITETEALDEAVYDNNDYQRTVSNSFSFSASDATTDKQSGMKTALSSSAAKVGKADSTRKLIRTAEISFEAKNTVQAVYAIEDITVRHGGFVQASDLKNRDYSYDYKEIKIGNDSTLRLTRYNIEGYMTLRVPAAKLDTTLKDIARWVEKLEYRHVKVNDVTLNALRSSLDRSRENRAAKRIETAVDNRGRRLGETVEGEEAIANRQERADKALLAGLELRDKIEYSSIQLSITQQPELRKERIANTDNIDSYQTPFGYRFVDALKWGGKALVEVLLFISHLWAFLLIAAVIFGIIIWNKKNKKQKNNSL